MLNILAIILTLSLTAQRGQTGNGAPAAPPQQAAPIDLSGYWVSLITDDWRYRMLTPPKGDYLAISLTPEGRRIADAWDPAKDESGGEQCKGYGAVGIMRLPGRLHITWENPSTLRVDIDTGKQTRLLHFGGSPPANEAATLQGYSAAQWQASPEGQPQRRGGELKVVTSAMRPGYLRRNGVPYSDRAALTEYFNRFTESNGDEYLIVTSILEDPTYLAQPYVRSSYFKREPDGGKWNPTPCSAR